MVVEARVINNMNSWRSLKRTFGQICCFSATEDINWEVNTCRPISETLCLLAVQDASSMVVVCPTICSSNIAIYGTPLKLTLSSAFLLDLTSRGEEQAVLVSTLAASWRDEFLARPAACSLRNIDQKSETSDFSRKEAVP